MSTSTVKHSPPIATKVWFDQTMIHVRLVDGRELSIPLEWFPKLRDASAAKRENHRLIGRGVGIHWPDLDEDLSFRGLLQGDYGQRGRDSAERAR